MKASINVIYANEYDKHHKHNKQTLDRLRRNRVSARKCRLRKKEEENQLLKELARLKEINRKLKEEYDALLLRVSFLHWDVQDIELGSLDEIGLPCT